MLIIHFSSAWKAFLSHSHSNIWRWVEAKSLLSCPRHHQAPHAAIWFEGHTIFALSQVCYIYCFCLKRHLYFAQYWLTFERIYKFWDRESQEWYQMDGAGGNGHGWSDWPTHPCTGEKMVFQVSDRQTDGWKEGRKTPKHNAFGASKPRHKKYCKLYIMAIILLRTTAMSTSEHKGITVYVWPLVSVGQMSQFCQLLLISPFFCLCTAAHGIRFCSVKRCGCWMGCIALCCSYPCMGFSLGLSCNEPPDSCSKSSAKAPHP